MKGKVKRSIAFLMVLLMVFNIGITAYAEGNPSNLDEVMEDIVLTPEESEGNSANPLEIEESTEEVAEEPAQETGEIEEQPAEPVQEEGEAEQPAEQTPDAGETENPVTEPVSEEGEVEEQPAEPVQEEGEAEQPAEQTPEPGTTEGLPEEVTPQPVDQTPIAIVEKAYEIQYLLQGTEEAIEGLEPIRGTAEVGTTIEIPHPEIEGYKVVDGQATSLVINEDEELNKVIVYYEKVEVAGEITLTVNHILIHDGKKLTHTEIIEGFKVGDAIKGSDYAVNEEGLLFIESKPVELTLGYGNNVIELIYELKDRIEEETSHEDAGKDNIVSGDTTLIEEPIIVNPLVTKLQKMPLLKAFTGFSILAEVTGNTKIGYPENENPVEYPQFPNPGYVRMEKSAQWVDKSKGTAKVVFNIKGQPVQQGVDAVLIIDRSGSMADKVTRQEVCGGKVELKYGSSSANFWGTVETRVARNVCNKCGKVYESVTQTRYRDYPWDSWGPWSPAPPAPHTDPCDNIITVSSNETRMDIAKEAAISFVRSMFTPSSGMDTSPNRVGLVSFSGDSGWPQYNLDYTEEVQISGSDAESTLIQKINSLRGNGQNGTSYDAAFTGAKNLLDKREDKSRPAYIIFLTDGDPNRGSENPKIAAQLKNDGVTIYAIGFQAGQTAYNKLKNIATQPGENYAFSVDDASTLVPLFNTIANNIKIAGTNAVLTDTIDSRYFHIDSGVANSVVASAGTNATVKGNTVTWIIGDITANGASLTIYIKLNDDILDAINEVESYPTNESARLTYKNFNEVNCAQIVDSPELTIGAGKITKEYYLVDGEGYPVNEAGTRIPFGDRVVLGSELFETIIDSKKTSLLPSGIYNPEASATITYNGNRYVYEPNSASHGGNTSGGDVVIDIDSDNQDDFIKTVYFGYKIKGQGEKLNITNYKGVYDGQPHSIEVTNLIAGDKVYYSEDGTNWSEKKPSYTNVGTYPVHVKVENPNYEDRTGEGTVEITPKAVTIKVNDARKIYGE
ncbi:VWA domain-containing protein, partial [Lutispora thermophila]